MIRLLFFILLISCGVRVQQDEVRSLAAPDNKILVIEEGKSVFKDIDEVLDSNQVARLSDIAIFDTASIYSVPTQTYILADTFEEGDYILTRNTGAWYKVQTDSVIGYTTDSVAVIPTGARYAVLQPQNGQYDVTWFGAVGDGVVDDQLSFNKLFQFGENISTSSYVFNTKSYYIGSTIFLPDSTSVGTRITIDGRGAILTTDQPIDIFSRYPHDPSYALIDNNFIIIKNIRFSGQSTIGSVGLRIGSAYSSVIEDCSFSGLDTALHLMSWLGGTIQRNRFSGILSISLLGSSGSWYGASASASQFNANKIISNRFYGNSAQNYNVYLVSCNNNILSNNITEGFSPNVAEIYISNNTGVSKNTFTENHWSETPDDSNVIILWNVGSGERLNIDGLKFGNDTVIKVINSTTQALVSIRNSDPGGLWIKDVARFSFNDEYPGTDPITLIGSGNAKYVGSSWDIRDNVSEGARYIGNYESLFLQSRSGGITIDNSYVSDASHDIIINSGEDLFLQANNTSSSVIDISASGQSAGRITQLGGTRSAWAVGDIFTPTEALHVRKNSSLYPINIKVENSTAGSGLHAGFVAQSNTINTYLRSNSSTLSGTTFGISRASKSELVASSNFLIGSISGSTYLASNDTVRMLIASSGEVNIGSLTDIGNYIMQITGDTYIDGSLTVTDSIILNGLSIISGAAAPAAGLGSQGSLYMRDDDDSTLYTKTATGWVLLN